MSTETLIVAAIATLLTIIVNRIVSRKKIQTINLEHIEENDQTFNTAFDSGYGYGFVEGQKAEMRERIIARKKSRV